MSGSRHHLYHVLCLQRLTLVFSGSMLCLRTTARSRIELADPFSSMMTSTPLKDARLHIASTKLHLMRYWPWTNSSTMRIATRTWTMSVWAASLRLAWRCAALLANLDFATRWVALIFIIYFVSCHYFSSFIQVWGRSADYLQANANSTDATTIAMKASWMLSADIWYDWFA